MVKKTKKKTGSNQFTVSDFCKKKMQLIILCQELLELAELNIIWIANFCGIDVF